MERRPADGDDGQLSARHLYDAAQFSAAPSRLRRRHRRRRKWPVRRISCNARGLLRAIAVCGGLIGTAGAGRPVVCTTPGACHPQGEFPFPRGLPPERLPQAVLLRRRPVVSRLRQGAAQLLRRAALLCRRFHLARPAAGRLHLPARSEGREGRQRRTPSANLKGYVQLRVLSSGPTPDEPSPVRRLAAHGGAQDLARRQGRQHRSASPEPILRGPANLNELHLQLLDALRGRHPSSPRHRP